MKKLFLCLSVLSLCALLNVTAAAWKQPTERTSTTNNTNEADRYISRLYQSLDFSQVEQIRYEVFENAMKGYLNLLNAGKLNPSRQILSIADFSVSSTQVRLWVIDLKTKKIRFNGLVAHGQGSGEDFATQFSNKEGSHASSIGFYVTGETYQGQHGNSLKLMGLDAGYNDAALERGIVIHAASYVSKAFIQAEGRLGRSWGCPALAPEQAQSVINMIKDGTCLFIYYPAPKYLAEGYWLNKKVVLPPQEIPLELIAPGLEHEHIADFREQKPLLPLAPKSVLRL